MRVGIVDTTFARVDMARYAIEELQAANPRVVIERITVPGFKNTPWAARKLIVEKECEGVLVLGWIGRELVDKLTYAVASLGLILVQLETGRPVIDVTIHEDEAKTETELLQVAIDRTRKHARNLLLLLQGDLSRWAGRGLRQGRPDVGPLIEGLGDKFLEW